MRGRFQCRCRSCDRPSDCVAGSVTLPDLRQAIANSDWMPVRARGHVAVDDRLAEEAWRRPELTDQLSRKAPFLGLGQSTRVMRNHPAQQQLAVFGVAEIPGTIQGVESGVVQIGRIPDVVQPRSRLNQLGIFSKKTA
jgi:hypothetical protein